MGWQKFQKEEALLNVMSVNKELFIQVKTEYVIFVIKKFLIEKDVRIVHGCFVNVYTKKTKRTLLQITI